MGKHLLVLAAGGRGRRGAARQHRPTGRSFPWWVLSDLPWGLYVVLRTQLLPKHTASRWNQTNRGAVGWTGLPSCSVQASACLRRKWARQPI